MNNIPHPPVYQVYTETVPTYVMFSLSVVFSDCLVYVLLDQPIFNNTSTCAYNISNECQDLYYFIEKMTDYCLNWDRQCLNWDTVQTGTDTV